MRISRPQLWMDMAEVAAKRATCFRGNCGALIVKDNDVVSVAYNGPPSGEAHCFGNECAIGPHGGCQRSLHAEYNAIHRARRKLPEYGLRECDLYCTYSPCPKCAEEILANRLHRFFYRYSYRDSSGLEKLIKSSTAVYRVTPSGFLVNDRTGQLCDEAAF